MNEDTNRSETSLTTHRYYYSPKLLSLHTEINNATNFILDEQHYIAIVILKVWCYINC